MTNNTLPFETEGGLDDPEKEWIGMPEFVQNDKKEYALIKVRIKSEEEFEEFKKLMDQPHISPTASIWFPRVERGLEIFDKRYVEEE